MTAQDSTLGKFSPCHLGFLVMPGFSLIAYAAAIDTLRIANLLQEKELYTWNTITPNNDLVKASNGLVVKPGRFPKITDNYDMLFVCGGTDIISAWTKPIETYLHEQDEQGVAFGALCTGSYILAKAGLLDGYRFTIHWEDIALIREEFSHLQITDDIYEIDQNRYTCAGGTTPIDMFLHLISRQYGRKLASEISETILIDHVRSMSDRQQIPLRQRIGSNQPKLTEIVMLMETNLEDPLTSSELAKLVNISKRQLERLFRLYLNSTPSRYYLELRMRSGRRLLLQTEQQIGQISVACGFSSSPNFSKNYRQIFGISPLEERRLLCT